MATIAWYVSGHGFGHASRDIEVLNELGRQRPDIAVTIRTPAPRWIFDLTLTRPVDWRPRESDTGVVQLDSLSLDAAETIHRAEAFHATLDEEAEIEAGSLEDVAMTGEITLSGLVLPVGGIREKALAARRHGIHTFILPALNAPDLEDIPEDLRRDMKFIPAETLDDVLRAAF